MEPVRLLLESVWAVAFNSPEEAQIVTDRLQLQLAHWAVLGVGVSLPAAFEIQATGLKTRRSRSPYLLYVGRLEAGKNLSQLYNYVRRFHQQGHRLKLVVVGKGPLSPPQHAAFDYRGYVPDDEMAAIMAGALALCQPSMNESFSLTMMESWLAGRPALVSEASAVTKGHVGRSKGGLWFESYAEFAGAVSWLLANDEPAGRMGRNGRRYVQANYTWPAVVDRFARIFSKWQDEADRAQSQRSGSRR
jgi:glycosyltransferase involved in cell wall biosynthesis